jgi:hypothetical protein
VSVVHLRPSILRIFTSVLAYTKENSVGSATLTADDRQ